MSATTEISGTPKWYYTFGSDEQFPFQHGWIVIEAGSQKEADTIFREHFPDRPGHEGILNCAFVYTEEQWARMDPEHNWTGNVCHGVYRAR